MNKYIYTEEHKLYDIITECCLVNLYSCGKSTGVICLNNFNPNNKNHLCMLEICSILKNISNLIIKVKTKNYFDYLKLIIKHKHLRKIVKYSNQKIELINIEEMLNYITDAYKIEDKQVWEKIYDLNFNRKNFKKGK